MVIQSRLQDVEFEWVGADGLYGEDPSFLRALDQMHEIFMVDVHKDQRIYLDDPRPVIPPASPGKGRPPTKLKTQKTPVRADEWAEQQPDNRWQRTYVRDTTKGKLLVDILHKRVWLWDEIEPNANCWHIIVRREIGAKKIIRQIKIRHKKRRDSIEFAYRKQLESEYESASL